MEDSINNSGYRKRQRARRWDLSATAFLGFLSCIVICLPIIFITTKITQGNWIARTIEDFTEKEVKSIKIRSLSEKNDTCVTPECLHAASEIMMKIDPSLKPCDNFYKFACGKFLNTTVIPNEKSVINAFYTINDKLKNQLRTSIEAESEINEPFSLVVKLYKSCMNTDVIEARGFQPLRKILKLVGGWPVLSEKSWQENDFDWMNVTRILRKIGYPTSFPINVVIQTDPINRTRHIIALSQAAVYPPREYLMKGFNDTFVQDYYSYMVDTAVILGARKDRATRELHETLLFHIQLANITRRQEEFRNATRLYNLMSLANLTNKYPGIPWRRYLNDRMAPGISVQDEEKIVVKIPGYINDAVKLLDITPKRVLANYLVWEFVRDSIEYLNDVIRQRQLTYLTAMTGKVEFLSRRDQCIRDVADYLPTIVGAIYVRKYFDSGAKKNAMEMVTIIGQQFNETLRKVKWLDEETRKRALAKAAAITKHVGYPDQLLDDSILREIFKNLKLSDDLYFENILNLTIFEVEYDTGKLRKAAINNDWIKYGNSAVVNAFYAPNDNCIVIPAGILQDPLFNAARPRYMNYAGIGNVIGHEIIHGFDDQGRQYDKIGNLFDWWVSSTKKRYEDRAKCIIEQYGNYTVDEVGLKLNGINTQGENVADIGGIKLAYHAYVNWSKTNGPEKKLPGLPYTPKQMFWISAATTWCTAYRPKFLEYMISQDYHSPAEFRIVGTFSNVPEFSQDFDCPIGSMMNPEKKCDIW